MNRRAFLVRMLGTAVALPIADRFGLLAREPAGVSWDGTLSAVHREAWRLYQRHLARLNVPIVEFGTQGQLGDQLPSGSILTKQLDVTIDRTILAPAVDAAMEVLAESAAFYGIDSYGSLALPSRVLYADRIGALRMISVFDVDEGDQLVRFDVIGGASPAGHVRQHQLRTDALKSRIQTRLNTSYRKPLPIPT